MANYHSREKVEKELKEVFCSTLNKQNVVEIFSLDLEI